MSGIKFKNNSNTGGADVSELMTVVELTETTKLLIDKWYFVWQQGYGYGNPGAGLILHEDSPKGARVTVSSNSNGYTRVGLSAEDNGQFAGLGALAGTRQLVSSTNFASITLVKTEVIADYGQSMWMIESYTGDWWGTVDLITL